VKAKTPEKSRQLAKADLNFISQKPLEVIVQEIHSRENAHITPQIVWSNSDTALFQLTYSRDKRITAAVTGRLQRWAGDMTHIYCDGRVFRTKTSYISSFLRWARTMIFVAPVVLCALTVITSSRAVENIFWISSVVFIVAFFVTGMQMAGTHFMQALNIRRINPNESLAKPEQKDRERLLHFLTEIIRDEDLQQQLQAQATQSAEPLSDAEVAAILQQAERMAKIKR
jgi:hypothetical protein